MSVAASAASLMSITNLPVDIPSRRGAACFLQSALAAAAHTHLFGYDGLLGMTWYLRDRRVHINACKVVNRFRPAVLVLREAFAVALLRRAMPHRQ